MQRAERRLGEREGRPVRTLMEVDYCKIASNNDPIANEAYHLDPTT
jgi:hypothetical protein